MTRRHVLALALTFAVAWLVLRVGVIGLPEPAYVRDFAPWDLAALVAGVLAGLVLWPWMLVHHWRHPPRHFNLFWTLVLVLGLHLGAAAYCLGVYLRAERTGP